MPEHSYQNMTLREKLREADLLLRELVDHVDRGFVPKAHALRKLAKEAQEPEAQVEDVTLRNHADQVLRAERFTAELFTKVDGMFTSIINEAGRIAEG